MRYRARIVTLPVMRFWGALTLVLLLGSTGCGDKRRAPGADPHAQTPAKAPAAQRPVEITQGMGVRLTGQPARNGSHTVEITVANAGSAAVRLSSALLLERQEGGTWSEVENVAGISLRTDCRTPAPECLSLVPGAELYPPPWLGTAGDVQCVCTRCGPVENGTYRFVAHSCDGDRVYRGTAFTVAR
ncbi:MAG: hypothetical protein IPK60_13935 [Sandaracinaceae bacterium]|nr:hypothetical protein [Sandaracinaceae bacterium]